MAAMPLNEDAQPNALSAIACRARAAYARRISDDGAGALPWWTAVIITASSARQAERYTQQLHERRLLGHMPKEVRYLVVPDLDDERIGSGGATLHALHTLAEETLADSPVASLDAWWATQRVLIIHSGGDSRRLPQYSLSGKLFSALPVRTAWGEVSTVFDEILTLSTPWVEQLPAGLVVTSGDAIVTFDACNVCWESPAVSAVAIREPIEVGCRHGIYVGDEQGRIYAFLQKPSAAQVRAAGGVLPDGRVALDTGVLRFAPVAAVRLTELAGVTRSETDWAFERGLLTRVEGKLPVIDLYDQVVQALIGEWTPPPDATPAWQALAVGLRGFPFRCDLVEGEFTHVGTTRLFRQLMTEETSFTRLYDAHQRLGAVHPTGVRSGGVVLDSVFASGGELGDNSLAIECALEVPVRAGRGAMLHGLSGLTGTVEVPDDTVVHQVPVALPDGRKGMVIRVYGVDDDPKCRVTSGAATWFGRPLLETLALLGLNPEHVWSEMPVPQRTLWNAALFPCASTEIAWRCARWLLGFHVDFSVGEWDNLPRLSLATSAQWADTAALTDARMRRIEANWQATALALSLSGANIRPLLAAPPRLSTLVATGRSLWSQAALRKTSAPTEAASLYCHAGHFFAQAGLVDDAERARFMAFTCVQHAVDSVPLGTTDDAARRCWQREAVTVSAPARIDLGGGWSDTPPFCQDWGGTVLNMAISLRGEYPIRASARRIDAPLIRCICEQDGGTEEYTTAEALNEPSRPGCSFAIPRTALQMYRLVFPGDALPAALDALGGGLEIRTEVNLPIGSGLGASSILAAAVLKALAEMFGQPVTAHALSDQVMRLEQLMTTGGGWQDQAGGIFPGVKLVTSGPGLRQRLRVQTLAWPAERREEFLDRFVLYYTGIRRIAKNLLAQVVGGYLAREVATVQVLHSIKTLAMEMMYALTEGEWDYLGQLLDRHWQLNQVLEPNTTNAPISALLQEVRPYLAGAKLAGAGGGGFLMLLAKDARAAQALRTRLSVGDLPGELYPYGIVDDGLRVETSSR